MLNETVIQVLTGSCTDTISKIEEKAQMSNKSKIGSSDQSKKYKIKQDEPRSNQFTDVFGMIFIDLF